LREKNLIDQIPIILKIFFFTFGVLIGSFLNVLIYRLPRDYNIVFPRSNCPNCNKLISWYENIPMISFIRLGGRCSGCGESISYLYPAIEFLTGLISLWLAPEYLSYDYLLNYFFLFTIMCIFLVHFIVDLKHKILPDSLNLLLFLLLLSHGWVFYKWTFWLSGLLIGFFVPFSVTWVFYLITKKIGMGGGDLKLYGCLGLYLGPIGIIYNISLSCMLGAIIGGLWLLVAKKNKNEPIPFGPFIIVISIFQIYYSDFFCRYFPCGR